MKFEIIRKDNRKKWIIGSLVVIILSSVIFFVNTRANYKVTQKVTIANGIINYNPSDLNVMAIKVQNSSGEYDNANSVPTSGYTLSNNSYCEVNGTKDTSITMEYKDGKVIIPVNTKNTKCYLYFNKISKKLIADILEKLTKKTRTDFSTVLEENTTGKIYSADDNDGTSYYFAGAVDNNWVKFGGFYWRIIRINGDGTLRMIYNGTTTDQTGESTQIGTSAFNYSTGYNAYIGYMYGNRDGSTYEETHTNTNSSNIKQVVDEWYNTNLNKDGIKEHIDINAGFCGDRSLASGTGIGNTYINETDYIAKDRLYTNKTPSFKCANSNDLYTVSSSNKGNKALTYPVGLITADEVAYAGGVTGNVNQSYYLHTGQDYWTISPFDFNGDSVRMFCVYSSESLNYGYLSNARGIRPVINLKSDTEFTGDGTALNPYTIA